MAAGGSPAGGSIELSCSGVAEVELVLMSTGWHWIGTGGNGSCVCTALTGGGVSRRLTCRCLECPGG